MDDELQGCTRAEQEQMLIKAVNDYNYKAAGENSRYENDMEPFNVLLPYRSVEFTIPNTIEGLEKLSRKQKIELISAYVPPGQRVPLSLQLNVWDSLNLTTYGTKHGIPLRRTS